MATTTDAERKSVIEGLKMAYGVLTYHNLYGCAAAVEAAIELLESQQTCE